MDKLLDIPKSKFGDENHFKWYRFQCDCLTPEDAMDVSVESWGKHDENKAITITMNYTGTGLWDRIKYAVAIIRGHWCWREFIVREEDLKNLSDILNPDKKYDELP